MGRDCSLRFRVVAGPAVHPQLLSTDAHAAASSQLDRSAFRRRAASSMMCACESVRPGTAVAPPRSTRRAPGHAAATASSVPVALTTLSKHSAGATASRERVFVLIVPLKSSRAVEAASATIGIPSLQPPDQPSALYQNRVRRYARSFLALSHAAQRTKWLRTWPSAFLPELHNLSVP